MTWLDAAFAGVDRLHRQVAWSIRLSVLSAILSIAAISLHLSHCGVP